MCYLLRKAQVVCLPTLKIPMKLTPESGGSISTTTGALLDAPTTPGEPLVVVFVGQVHLGSRLCHRESSGVCGLFLIASKV